MMKKYFQNLSCVLVLFMSFQALAQRDFPENWLGNYKGELQIYGVDSVNIKLTMKLDIQKKKDSTYQWKMTYDFRGKEDIRDYELKIIDRSNGHFVIDELNTIVIDGYYKSGIFTSFFEVMDSYIISTYTKRDDDLIFEIIAANGKQPRITGNQNFNGEDIPKVKAFNVNGRQRAVLKKY
jgi:hypothetical protein